MPVDQIVGMQRRQNGIPLARVTTVSNVPKSEWPADLFDRGMRVTRTVLGTEEEVTPECVELGSDEFDRLLRAVRPDTDGAADD